MFVYVRYIPALYLKIPQVIFLGDEGGCDLDKIFVLLCKELTDFC